MAVEVLENDALIPRVALDMEHKVILTDKQKELLLEERQHIIEDSIYAVQKSFFRIGKALAEIRKFGLYKADPLYPNWKDYIAHRIVPKLHQSTISDYISIVRMQLENKEFIQEEDLVRLGYKKVKLLKSKLNVISKEKDMVVRRQLLSKFKDFYERSFQEFRDLPYSTYEKALALRLEIEQPVKESGNMVIEKSNADFVFKFDKKRNKIVITPIADGNSSKLESFFHLISDIQES